MTSLSMLRTVQDALEAGNEAVISSGQMGTPDSDIDDIEYMVDIYYNVNDSKFYITKAYHSNDTRRYLGNCCFG